jgi:hypothetical protein
MNFSIGDDLLSANPQVDEISVRRERVYPRDFGPRSGRDAIRAGMMELIAHMGAFGAKYGIELVVDVIHEQEAQALWREDDLAWLTLIYGTSNRYPLDRNEVLKGHSATLREMLDEASVEKLRRHMEFEVRHLPANPRENVVYEKWRNHRPSVDMIWKYVEEHIPRVVERKGVTASRVPKHAVVLNTVTMFIYMVTMNPSAHGTHVRRLVRGAYSFALEHVLARRALGVDPATYVSRFVSGTYGPLVHDILVSAEVDSAVHMMSGAMQERTMDETQYLRAKRVLIGALRDTTLIREVTRMLSENTLTSVSRDVRFNNLFGMYKLLVLILALVDWICSGSQSSIVNVDGLFVPFDGGSGSGRGATFSYPVMKAKIQTMCETSMQFVPMLREKCPKLQNKFRSLFATLLRNLSHIPLNSSVATQKSQRAHNFTLVLRALYDVALYYLYAWYTLKLIDLEALGAGRTNAHAEVYGLFRNLKLSLKRARFATEAILASRANTRMQFVSLYVYMVLTARMVDVLHDEISSATKTPSHDAQRTVVGVLFDLSPAVRRNMGQCSSEFFSDMPSEGAEPPMTLQLMSFGSALQRSSTETSLRVLNTFFLTGLYRTLDELDQRTQMTLLPLLSTHGQKSSHPLVQQTSQFRSHLLDLILILRKESVVNYSALEVTQMSATRSLPDQCAVVQSEAKTLIDAVHAEFNKSDVGLVFIACSPIRRDASDVYPVGSTDLLARHMKASKTGPDEHAQAQRMSDMLFLDAVRRGDVGYDPVMPRNAAPAQWDPSFIAS